MSGKVSPFVKIKKTSTITKLKTNLQDINKNTIDASLTDTFYTQKIQMYNAVTNVSS